MMKKICSAFLAILILFSIGGQAVRAEIYYEPEKVIKARTKVNLNKLKGKSVVVLDMKTGTRLYDKKSDTKRSIASLTKVMSMLLIMEAIDSGKIKESDKVPVSENAYLTEGSQVWLDPNEKFTVKQLLEAVAIHSANDAVVALAEYIAGSENAFVEMMNNRAAELGCTNTKFIDSNGLHDMVDGHYSTPNDMVKISMELMEKHPKIVEYTSIWQKMFRPGSNQVLLENTNKLVHYYKGTIGLKTGWTTDAGHNLITVAERDDKKIMVAIFGYEDTNVRFAEAMSLMDDVFSNYSYVTKAKQGEVAGVVAVTDSENRKYDCVYDQDALLYVKSENVDNLTTEFIPVENLQAPVSVDTKIGSVVFKSGDTVVKQIDFYPKEEIKKAGFFKGIWNWFIGLFE